MAAYSCAVDFAAGRNPARVSAFGSGMIVGIVHDESAGRRAGREIGEMRLGFPATDDLVYQEMASDKLTFTEGA